MANDLLPKQRVEARTRGLMALGGWAATGFAFWHSWSYLTAAIAVAAGIMTWRWFSYRAKWGLRF